MSSSLNLSINISAIDAASSVISGVGKAISDLASGNIAGAAMAIGTAVVGIGAASVKMAADFQSGITTLETGAGESKSNLQMVADGIKNIAVQTGTSTQQLTDGMFAIESAGFRGADGLNVLKAAAEGAKAQNADLGTVGKAVSTILVDYHLSASQATNATNALITTVQSGNMHLQDLAGSMGAVLPIASAMGVSFPQVGAAIATMTNSGMSAQQAAQNLAHTMLALSAPNKAAQKAMQAVGIDAQGLKDTLSGPGGLSAAIQQVEHYVNQKFPAGSVEAVNAFKAIMGGATGYSTALKLGGKNMLTFESNINSISGAMKAGGSDIQNWSDVQSSFNFKLQQAQQVVNVLMINLGTALLPILGNLLTAFINLGTPIQQVTSFFQHNQLAMDGLKAVLAGVAAGVLAFAATAIPALVAGFLAWAAAAGAAALATLITAAPFILIGLVVAAVVFGIIEAVQHWGQITAWLQSVWGAVSSWFMGMLGDLGAFFVGIWNDIASFFVGLWQGLVGHAKQGGSAISSWWTGLWNGIVAGAKAAWNFIVQAVHIGIQVLLAIILGPFILIGQAFVWLYNHNYYFKALVDSIVGFFKACIAWVQMAWTATVAWLAALWQQIVSVATTAWNAVVSAITFAVKAVWTQLVSVWTTISNWLVGAWNAVVKFATNLWNQIAKAVQTAWNAAVGFVVKVWQQISAAFSSAWATYIVGPLTALWTNVSNVFMNAWNTYIVAPLTGLWNSISKWFTDLGTNAENSGKNFISMLVSGIVSGTGAIWDAVLGIAKTIWAALGFHSPAKEGPGADADKWMPNLVNMLSSDLTAGVPQIQAAVNAVVQPLAMLGSPQAATAAVASAPVASGGNNNNIAINVNLNGGSGDAQKHGKDIADVVKKELARHLRQQSIAPRYTSGGTHQ